jgi:RNA-splicing ligase RtcB
MIEISGKNGTAKVFIDHIDETTTSQLIAIMNHPVSEGSIVRIMPDCHAGKGCVVGTTMTLTDRIVPNIVGVDIGCGMYTVQMAPDLDLKKLDDIIHESVPSGRNVHSTPTKEARQFSHIFQKIKCPLANIDRDLCSIGSLGGGNHFIEVSKSKAGANHLVIHTGSRHLGLEVANYYQKAAGIEKQKDTAYLTKGNGGYEDYLHDMDIVQQFAAENRMAIARLILKHFPSPVFDFNDFHTVHNYIDIGRGIVRKGAVSATFKERLLIPMNMHYGSLLCIGRGNADWNFSAPHGAGRLMSRSQAKKTICVDDYRAIMADVYSSTVNESTLDEAPFAYKSPDTIIEAIKDTVEVWDVLKPIYNFKSSE